MQGSPTVISSILSQSNMEAMGMEDMKESDLGDVGRFLNRLLGLKIPSQNMVSYDVGHTIIVLCVVYKMR